MRTVASENESQGSQGQGRLGARSAALRKQRRRAAVLERLEQRALLAVLPPIAVQGTGQLVDISNGGGAPGNINANSQPNGGNQTSPSVAIDPTAPQDMVAVWVSDSISNGVINNGQTAVYVQGAYSTNAGKSWTAFSNGLADSTIDINQAQNNGARFYSQVTDPTVAFDAQHNVYVLDSPRSGDFGSGELALNKFKFQTGASPAPASTTIVYQWAQQDAAYRPTLAVDSNPNFSGTDGQGNPYTQTDPFVNNVYVAWSTNDAIGGQYQSGEQNPNRIALAGSSDGGTTFSSPELIDGSSYYSQSRNASPQLVVSQGRPIDTAAYGPNDTGVQPGQLTVIWDDTTNGGVGGNVDKIASSRVQDGSGAMLLSTFTKENGSGPGDTSINEASPPPPNSTVNGPSTTTFDIDASSLPANFNPTDLAVTLGIQHSNLQELNVVLQAPSGVKLTLFQTSLSNDTAQPNQPFGNTGVNGANLGQSVSGQFVGTTFDDNAARVITEQNGGPASVGTFTAEGGGGANTVATLHQLLASGPPNGVWKLIITDQRNNSNKPPQQLNVFSLRFTSATQVDLATVNTPVTTTAVRGAVNANPYPLDSGGSNATSPVPDAGIGPGAVIASDNTLGAFSPHQGRIYVAYTDIVTQTHLGSQPTVNNIADNTNVYLKYSDDGGVTWHAQGKVNNDNATTDGYTESGQTVANGVQNISGRAQFQPAVTVDPANGTLVVSFRDARDDASRSRVATYIATSLDGGSTFGPQTYVNVPQTATDAITGQKVVLGPIPDNQSLGNTNRDTTDNFDFGNQMALAALDGRLYPVWSGNENGAAPGSAKLNIFTANAFIASGPRIVSSDMGPVQPGAAPSVTIFNPANSKTSVVSYNDTTTADGTPILNGFTVTFDRPIDPATFNSGQVTLKYEDTTGKVTAIPAAQISVSPIFVASDPSQDGHFGFERFLVRFPDQSGVGTYSYTIGPDISDRIVVAHVLKAAQQPPVTFGTAANQTPIPTSGSGGSGIPANDTSTSFFTIPAAAIPANDTIGNITVNINNLTMATGSLGALKIELLTSTGDDLVLYNNTGDPQTQFANTTFSDAGQPIFQIPGTYAGQSIQPASGTLGSLIGELADQTYTLKITDQQAGNTGKLFDWSVTIRPVNPASGQQTGNLMDQNANGTGGEAGIVNAATSGDVYAVPALAASPSPLDPSPTGTFSQDSLPLIIPGPQLIGTTVPEAAAGSSLALNATVDALDTMFNRDMLVSSFTPSDILRMMGPAGLINGPFTVTPAFNAPPPAGGGTIAAGQTVYFPFTIANHGTFTIQDLRLRMNLSAADDGYLTAVLNGPNGKQIILFGSSFGPVGTGSANFSDTVLDDHASTPIAQGIGPFAGSYKPAMSLDSAFGGAALNGQWVLGINNGGPTAATLNSWSLEATPSNAGAVARTFRVGFATQQLSGTYTAQIASSVTDDQGHALDQNQNAGLQILRQVDPNGTILPVTYNSTDATTNTPLPISDVAPNNVTTSIINVPDDFPVQAITLRLNITYPNDPDLIISLAPPTGAPITLFNGPNGNNNNPTPAGANFNNTVIDDSATTSIENATPPYSSTPTTNHFRSAQATLSTVVNASSKGQWKLIIQDVGKTNLAGLTAQLNNWSLTLSRGVPNTGLGEPVADQALSTFRIFTMAPNNPLASDTWTAVGPASIGGGGGSGAEGGGGGGRSGRIGGLAVDPSDPSGNTVYIGGASGGIWKTTDFLSANGPTWIPLTDFGPTFGINIGSIAVLSRNNDPNQSILFAATGEGDTGTPGVGFLRSMDGGATWTLLGSTNNNLPFANQDHIFAQGTTAYKVVVDPTLTPQGTVVVYAALSGPQGGIWRSTDSGLTWQKVLAGQATDVVLDPFSGKGVPLANGEPSGNLQIVYAGLQGQGVFMSPDQGTTWLMMAGNVGNPLILNDKGKNVNPTDLGSEKTPNGPNGRIELAVPALTGNPNVDVQYEGWLYAGVITPDSHFQGLYLTKDQGQNWTQVRIPTLGPVAGGVGQVPQAIPTNDANNPAKRDYDVGGGPAGTGLPAQGNYDFSLGIDPTNPNVVYMGGTADGQPTGFIRIDTTGLYDAHALVPTSGQVDDNGTLQHGSTGRAVAADQSKGIGPGSFLNFGLNPTGDSTLSVTNVSAFSDTGAGATWIPFDLGGTDQHRIVTIVDPLTHHARLIIGDDQGVYTTVDNHGTYDSGIGSASGGVANSAIGDQNGNLQITQFYYGALQPSNVAAQVAQAMFYGSAQDNGGPASDPNVLTDGNISWGGPGGDAGGVATDPQGLGTLNQFWWPCCGGNDTDFFQVNGVGKTKGLLQASNGLPTPDPEWPTTFGANFAVNPVDGQQVIVSSTVGRIFRTENGGNQWVIIGQPNPAQNVLDGSYAPALAFGASDPNGPQGTVGNLDDFIYAGTSAGHIFVSQTGGGGAGNQWTDITNGALAGNGAGIAQIIADPLIGSHDAYAVTGSGVYFNMNTVADATGPPAAQWVNITGNLAQLTHNIFGSAAQVGVLDGGLDTIVADWRYLIPNAAPSNTNPNAGPVTHPILYAGGQGGVFRSLDNGQTWTVFPNMAQDGSPANGGYLPVAKVTDLQVALGDINPSTGAPLAIDPNNSNAVSPNLLMASTFGRGAFAIRLAPIIFSNTNLPGQPDNFLHLDPASDTGTYNNDQVTNNAAPFVDGLSEESANGNTVTIKLYDHAADPNHLHPIGTGTTDTAGRFKVQIAPGYFKSDGSSDGSHTLDVQAIDQSGTAGPFSSFTFLLDTTPPKAPTGITLDKTTDSGPLPGQTNSDGYTNFNDATANAPLFDVTGVEPNAIVELLRNGVVVGTATASPAGGTVKVKDVNANNTTIPDSPVGSPADTPPPAGKPYVYTALQIDVAGNAGSQMAPAGGAKVIIDATPPKPPTSVTLDKSTDSGPLPGQTNADSYTSFNNSKNNAPLFDVSGVEPNATVELFRDGVLVGMATAGPAGGLVKVYDTNGGNGAIADNPPGTPGDTSPGQGGVPYYVYTAAQIDLAGNVGPQDTTGAAHVIIDSTAPQAPTSVTLDPSTDSGPANNDDYTNFNNAHGNAPIFDVAGIEPNATVELLRNGFVVGTAVAGPAGGTVKVADINGNNTTIPDSPVGSPADTPPPSGNPYNYTAIQVDLAGNLSQASRTFGNTGAIVIDGTDADNHGDDFGPNGTNEQGWKYMQTVLNLIQPNVTNQNKVVVALGVHPPLTPHFGATAAITSSFDQSNLPGLGWKLVYLNTPANIDTFLGGGNGNIVDVNGNAIGTITLAQTGLLYITTDHGLGDDMTDQELTVVNQHGPDIKNFVNGGGGLYSQAETPFSANVTAYGWLENIFPTIQVVNVGPGGNGPNNVQITPQGQKIFPTLTPNDISSGPWHDYFQGTFGSLAVAATDFDDTGVLRDLILASVGTPTANPSQVIIDSTPPVAPTLKLDPSTDSGRLNGDDYTSFNNANNNAPLFDVTNVEPNATVELFRNGVLVNSVKATPQGGLVTIADINGGRGTIPDSPPGSPPDTAPPAGNPYQYTAIQVDLAGNVGAPSSKLPVIIASKPPAAPTSVKLDPTTDSGPLPGQTNADSYTNFNNSSKNAPLFDVTGVLPNATVELLRNGVVVNTVIAPAGNGLLTIKIPDINGGNGTIPDSPVGNPADTPPPAGNPYVYTAIQIDLAGNLSAPSSPGDRVIIDATPPALPNGLKLDPSTDSGPLPGQTNTDSYTNFNNSVLVTSTNPGNAPTIDVSNVEPNATVQLFRQAVVNGKLVGSPVMVGQTVAGAAGGTVKVKDNLLGKIADNPPGSPIDTPPKAATPGVNTYLYSARQVDLAGNPSAFVPPYGNKGAVIFDTIGAAVTGDNNGPNGTNEKSWLLMQEEFDLIRPNISNGNKTFVALGVNSGFNGFRLTTPAVNSAFAQSSLPANGWNLVFVSGASNIDAYLSGLPATALDGNGNPAGTITLAKTGLLNITAMAVTIDGGDTSSSDIGVIDKHGADIQGFVESGGGLYAQNEDPAPSSGNVGFGWAASVIPGFQEAGGGGPSLNTLVITPQGQQLYPSLQASVASSPQLYGRTFSGNLSPFIVVAGLPQGSGANVIPLIIASSGIVDYSFPTLVTIDTTPPAAPTSIHLDPSTDSGPLPGQTNGDSYTSFNNAKSNAPIFDVTGIEPNATVELFRNGVLVNMVTAGPAGGTVKIADTNAGKGTIPDSVVGNPADTPPPAGNPYIYTALQVDLAGNVGPQMAPASGTKVIIDSKSPLAPTSVTLDPSTDSGPLPGQTNSDSYTNFNNSTPSKAPLFDVSGIEPNATVELFRDGVLVGMATAGPAGGLVKVYDTNGGKGPIADNPTGTPGDTAPGQGGRPFYTYTAIQVDLAGNAGPQNTTGAAHVIVDTTAPAPPAGVTLDKSTDSGPLPGQTNGDNYTSFNNSKNNPPLFDVTGIEPNATVELFRTLNGNTVLVGSAVAGPAGGLVKVADINGNNTRIPDSPVGTPPDTSPLNPPPGSALDPYTYSVVQIDLAGNVSKQNVTFGNTGAVVVTGLDENLHGDNLGPGGTNENGWLMMQKVLNLIEPNVTNGKRTLVALGVDSSQGGGTFGATGAIDSAYLQSNLAKDGWNIVFVTGATNMDTYLSGQAAQALDVNGKPAGTITLGQTGLLNITTDWILSDNMTDAELAVVDKHGPDIKQFVNAGGGLYAQTENPNDPKTVVPFGWLSSVFPGLQGVESGGSLQGLQITPQGQKIFPTLQASDISADYHSNFAGNFGSLAVVATVPDFFTGAPLPIVLASVGVSASQPLQVIIDSTPPTTPTAPALDPSTDTGTFNNDDLTNFNNATANPANPPLFDLKSVEPNATVELFRAQVFYTNGVPSSIGTPVLVDSVNPGAAGGAVQVADTNAGKGKIPDGVYDYTFEVVDLAGNVSASSKGTLVTIDATPPVAPSAPSLLSTTDSGTFNNDKDTNFNNSAVPPAPSNAPMFSVTGIEPHATVKLYRNGVLVNTLVNTAGGTILIPDTNGGNGTILDGTYTYRAQQVDLAGNVGPFGPSTTVVIDHTAPAAPSAFGLDPTTDSGTFNNDVITFFNNSAVPPAKSNAPLFDVSVVEPNATVVLFRAPVTVVNGNTVVGAYAIVNTLVDTAGGTIQIPDTNAGRGKIADGTYSYTTEQIDLAGNVGPKFSPALTVIVDATAPAAVTLQLDPASDTGRFNNDGITQITISQFPTFDVYNVVVGATVNLYRAPVTNGTVGAAVLVDTSSDTAGGTVQIQDTNGNKPIPDGTYVYTAQQVDLAGNVGPIGGPAGEPKGGTIRVTYDTVEPAQPPAPTLDPSSRTGNGGPGTTNDHSPTFDVTGILPHAKVTLLRDGATIPGEAVVYNDAGGATVLVQDPGTGLTDGFHSYTVFQTDLAGNNSPISPPLQVSFSPSAPGVPTLDATTDSGNPGDDITNFNNSTLPPAASNAPVFDVTGVSPGSTLELFRANAATPGNATVVDSLVAPAGTGLETVKIADTNAGLGTIPDGTYVYTTVQVDTANTTSPSSAPTFVTILSSAPVPGLSLDPASDTRGNNITVVTTPTFDVTNVVQGATVTLSRQLAGSPTVQVVATLSNAAAGTVQVTDNNALTPGNQYIYSVSQTDIAGNVSRPSGTVTVTVITSGGTTAVPGDYNGAGKTDLALYRRVNPQAPGSALWLISNASPAAGYAFGSTTLDIPVQGNFTGTTSTDLAVYEPSTATWQIATPTGNSTLQVMTPPGGISFGQQGVDIPVPGNYDNPTVTQIAVYRPTTGQWFIAGHADPIAYGEANVDIPVPGDWYGNGETQIAVYRPGTPSQWLIPGLPVIQYGGPNDIPVPGNWDGSGKTTVAVFRPSDSTWFIPGLAPLQFGMAGTDIPAPGDYLGLGRLQVAVYRPGSPGQLLVAGSPDPVVYGGPFDVPANAPYDYRAAGVLDAATVSGNGGGTVTAQSVGGPVATSLDFGSSALTLSAATATGPAAKPSASQSFSNLPAGQGTSSTSPATVATTFATTPRVRPNTTAGHRPHRPGHQHVKHQGHIHDAALSALEESLGRFPFDFPG